MHAQSPVSPDRLRRQQLEVNCKKALRKVENYKFRSTINTLTVSDEMMVVQQARLDAFQRSSNLSNSNSNSKNNWADRFSALAAPMGAEMFLTNERSMPEVLIGGARFFEGEICANQEPDARPRFPYSDEVQFAAKVVTAQYRKITRKKHRAALKIQTQWRRFQVFHIAKEIFRRRREAAIFLQREFRRRRNVFYHNTKLRWLMKYHPPQPLPNPPRLVRPPKITPDEVERRFMVKKLAILVKFLRRVPKRRKQLIGKRRRMERLARRVQSMFRGIKGRKRVKRMIDAQICISRAWRSFVLMRYIRVAKKLKRHVRVYLLKKRVIKIQRLIRLFLSKCRVARRRLDVVATERLRATAEQALLRVMLQAAAVNFLKTHGLTIKAFGIIASEKRIEAKVVEDESLRKEYNVLSVNHQFFDPMDILQIHNHFKRVRGFANRNSAASGEEIAEELNQSRANVEEWFSRYSYAEWLKNRPKPPSPPPQKKKKSGKMRPSSRESNQSDGSDGKSGGSGKRSGKHDESAAADDWANASDGSSAGVRTPSKKAGPSLSFGGSHDFDHDEDDAEEEQGDRDRGGRNKKKSAQSRRPFGASSNVNDGEDGDRSINRTRSNSQQALPRTASNVSQSAGGGSVKVNIDTPPRTPTRSTSAAIGNMSPNGSGQNSPEERPWSGQSNRSMKTASSNASLASQQGRALTLVGITPSSAGVKKTVVEVAAREPRDMSLYIDTSAVNLKDKTSLLTLQLLDAFVNWSDVLDGRAVFACQSLLTNRHAPSRTKRLITSVARILGLRMPSARVHSSNSSIASGSHQSGAHDRDDASLSTIQSGDQGSDAGEGDTLIRQQCVDDDDDSPTKSINLRGRFDEEEEEGSGSGSNYNDDGSDGGDGNSSNGDTSSEKSCNMHRPYRPDSMHRGNAAESGSINDTQTGSDSKGDKSGLVIDTSPEAAVPLIPSPVRVVPVSKRSLFTGALARSKHATGRYDVPSKGSKNSLCSKGKKNTNSTVASKSELGSATNPGSPAAIDTTTSAPAGGHVYVIKTDYDEMNEDREEEEAHFALPPSPSAMDSPGHARDNRESNNEEVEGVMEEGNEGSVSEDRRNDSEAEDSYAGDADAQKRNHPDSSSMRAKGNDIITPQGSVNGDIVDAKAGGSVNGGGGGRRGAGSVSGSSIISGGSASVVVFNRKSDLSVPSDINEAVQLYAPSSKVRNYVALWRRLPDHVIARAIFVRKWSIYFDTICRLFLAQHRQKHPPRRCCSTCMMPSCMDISPENHSCSNFGMPPAWIPKSAFDDAMVIYFEVLDALKTYKFENFKFP